MVSKNKSLGNDSSLGTLVNASTLQLESHQKFSCDSTLTYGTLMHVFMSDFSAKSSQARSSQHLSIKNKVTAFAARALKQFDSPATEVEIAVSLLMLDNHLEMKGCMSAEHKRNSSTFG